MEKISVILLSWKRSKNIPIILKNLYSSERIDEIILWNNNPKITLTYKHPKLQVINSPHNYGTLIRYCLAGASKNQNIMFQDDDLFYTEAQIEKLFTEYIKDTNRLYGPLGRNLENYKYNQKDSWGWVDIIIGRTILFHKRHLYKFFKYWGTGNFRDDILFSFSLKTKHLAINLGKLNDLPDQSALSKRADHLQRRQEMVDYCLRVIPGLKKVIGSKGRRIWLWFWREK